MKTHGMKLAAVAILLVAGITVLNAQYYRGAQYLRNQRGGCLTNSALTAEQQVKVQELSVKHQAAMDGLRAELWSTTDPAQATLIRAKMDQLQATHRVAIIELGAVPANIPHAGYYGYGRGAGAGYGRGAAIRGGGRGAGWGAGRAGYGGRGLGPCGAGLGPRW